VIKDFFNISSKIIAKDTGIFKISRYICGTKAKECFWKDKKNKKGGDIVLKKIAQLDALQKKYYICPK